MEQTGNPASSATAATRKSIGMAPAFVLVENTIATGFRFPLSFFTSGLGIIIGGNTHPEDKKYEYKEFFQFMWLTIRVNLLWVAF